jgi:hypothetical protein
VLGHFSIERVDIRKEFGTPAAEKKRQAVFLLTGPSKLWLCDVMRTLSYTGDVSVRHRNPALPLDSVRDQISTAPHFVYAEYPRAKGTPRETGQAELFALTVDDAFDVARDGTAFAADSSALTDRLCLLMSFLSKTYVSWFACTYSDGHEVLQSYRNVQATDNEAPRWEELVLYPADIRPFLNQAFAGYEKNTLSGFDLRMPMLHYIWAQSSRFAEDHFTTLFFALEKLLSSLDERNPEDDLLTDPELRKLWRVMCPTLEEMGKTPKQMALMLSKRQELQRAPLMHRIERHLTALEIDISDIGGRSGRTHHGSRSESPHS